MKQINHPGIFKIKFQLDSKQELDDESVRMEEARLLQLASQGDLGAFNELVLKYQNLVFSHAYGLLGNDIAEDISQDTFILAFQKPYQFRRGSLRAWLLKIATNLCYDKMRSWKRAPLQPLEPIHEDGEINESPHWIKDPNLLSEESIEIRELRVGIERGLSTLPINFRIAVTLVDIQELSYEEAALIMGTSIGTLKSRLARGRLMLRNALMKIYRANGLTYEFTRREAAILKFRRISRFVFWMTDCCLKKYILIKERRNDKVVKAVLVIREHDQLIKSQVKFKGENHIVKILESKDVIQ